MAGIIRTILNDHRDAFIYKRGIYTIIAALEGCPVNTIDTGIDELDRAIAYAIVLNKRLKDLQKELDDIKKNRDG